MGDIKSKILEIFENYREKGSNTFSENGFLQYLIKDNSHSLDDSFKGKRYKNRFLDAIQKEFFVCFPQEVFEKQWDLEAFVRYVEERRKKPKANLKLAENRLTSARQPDVNFLIVLNSLFLLPLMAVKGLWMLLFLLPAILGNLLYLWWKLKEIRFYQTLLVKIKAATHGLND